MAFCKNCGAELVDGAKFCKRCGAPAGGQSYSAPRQEYEYEPEPEPKPKKQKKASSGGKKPGKGQKMLLLLIAVIGIGYYLYSSGAINLSSLSDFTSGFNDGRSSGRSSSGKNLNSMAGSIGDVTLGNVMGGFGLIPEGDDDEAPAGQNPTKSGQRQPEILSSSEITYDDLPPTGITADERELNGMSREIEADFKGGEALIREMNNSIYDLEDGDADPERYDDKFYEVTGMSLYGYSLAKYRNAYVGDWTSVGIYQTEFKNVAHLINEDVASMIDQNMVLTDQVRFIYTRKKCQMWLQGKLQLEGVPDIIECGNINVRVGGEYGFYWMYMPIDGVLFQYIYYTDDDGKEMVSCVKYNRTLSSQR